MALLVGLPGLALSIRAMQSGEIFSPASGHAQVIAQGVANLSGNSVWRTVFHSVAPGEDAELPLSGPGFILVDTGGVIIDDEGRSALLAPAEAVFTTGGVALLAVIGERPAGVFAINAVSPDDAADAGGGIPVYASAPFEVPPGERDFNLVRDLLEPGESTTVIGDAAPVLVVVTLGAVSVEASDGSSANLRVGEAATFTGDVVITADGQAPSTFVAAVIGRETSRTAIGTPGATPRPVAVGSVQLTLYACPPLVSPGDASPGRCLRDPEAAALALDSLDDPARDVGPSSERQGLPTWVGLPGGEYALRASSFKDGFGRFFVQGLEGVTGEGNEGFPAAEDGGYLIPISSDAADYSLEVYVLAPGDGATPAAAASTTPIPTAPTAPAAEATEEATAPAGPTEIPSVIQIETAVPGGPTATPRPRATSTPTPRPNPIARATVVATERPLVNSTAVARPSQGTVGVRVFGCQDSIDLFNPANCAQSADGFDVRLISEDGETIALTDATIESDGSVSWKNLPLGTYLFQQPVMLSGAVTYYAPEFTLAENGAGYVVTIDTDEPVAAIDVYNLPPPPAALSPTVAPVALDSDLDGIPDADETGIYGTDPVNADSDFDGVLDGAELGAGSDPLVADPAAADVDSDGDGLLDGDEAAFSTDPSSADSDGDGWFDGDEVNIGTDPLDGASFPVG